MSLDKMKYKSRDVHIGDNKKFFWKNQRDNIYSIFIDLDNWTLENKKYCYQKIEFHTVYKDKNFARFVRYIYFKKGRTILSCVKEMINHLLEKWNIDQVGHFVVIVE